MDEGIVKASFGNDVEYKVELNKDAMQGLEDRLAFLKTDEDKIRLEDYK